MVGLIIKVIVCPIVLLLSDYFLGDVNFSYVSLAIIVGIAIAVIGHVMELLLLKKGTVWLNTTLDFGTTFAVVFLSQYFSRGISITIPGALIVAFVVAVIEHFVHLYLVRSGKAEKDEV